MLDKDKLDKKTLEKGYILLDEISKDSAQARLRSKRRAEKEELLKSGNFSKKESRGYAMCPPMVAETL